MKVAQLRDVADEFGLDHDGMLKKEIRGLILDHLGLSSEPAKDSPF